MLWPATPTVHKVDPVFRVGEIVWREARNDETYGMIEPFRTCSYCGSIHPEDLVRHMKEGAQLQGSDWKYGWPHKFYVEGIPNLFQGEECRHGTSIKDGVETPIIGRPSKHVHAKWYNEHIMDEGFDDAARAELLKLLTTSGIEFFLDDGKVKYKAPHLGYQKP